MTTAFLAFLQMVSLTSLVAPREWEPATIQVRVPDAAAELLVDGNATRQTGLTRHFVTPPLLADTEYAYQLTCSWYGDGPLLTEERHVTVRAGETVVVDFRTSAAREPMRK